MADWGAVAGLASAGGQSAFGIGGLISSKKAREQNYEISQQNLAEQQRQFNYEKAFAEENRRYQRDLQGQIFQREDTAVQRRAADLQAAGLSKTLAAGSGASAGSVVATSGQTGTRAPQNKYKAVPLPWDKMSSVVKDALGVAQQYNSLMQQKKQMSFTDEQIKLAQLQKHKAEHDLTIYKDLGLPSTEQLGREIKIGKILKHNLEKTPKVVENPAKEAGFTSKMWKNIKDIWKNRAFHESDEDKIKRWSK